VPRDYEKKREGVRRREVETSRSARDIAPLPEVVDEKRRARGEKSLESFLREYMPGTFSLPWSASHREIIADTERIIRGGGLKAYAMPRGSGKTSVAIGAAIWALIYGYLEFVALIGADEGAASSMLDSIRAELETNDRLLEDFPEVCYPIRKLEGIAHRCNGQLFEGQRTHIGWTAKEIVLPTIPGSKASAGTVRVTGITGGIRGMQFTRPDGRKVRPRFALIDDPQTDESARSPSQVEARLATINGAVLGLAGPGQRMSVVMPCTVISPDDVADRLLDRKKHPEWQGTRTKLLDAYPSNAGLWEQYAQIRAQSLAAGNDGREGTEFYRANREAMDAGAVATWPARHKPDELSAVQHAMNLRLRDEASFEAEYQNEPKRKQTDATALKASDVMARLSRVPKGVAPVGSAHVTGFIDVQGKLLYWLLLATAPDFTASVIDYGVWPEQGRAYFTLSDAKRTLQQQHKGTGLEGAIHAGLTHVLNDLASRKVTIEGTDAAIGVGRIFVDANWGESTDTVYLACRQSPHRSIVMPSHGKAIGASAAPFESYKRQTGQVYGEGWMMPQPKAGRGVRHLLIDTNRWKSFAHARLSTAMGDPGALTLYGSDANAHRMLVDHWLSEYPTAVESKGRKVDEWKLKPNQDNHLWDCLVGALCGAHMLGARLFTRRANETPVKPTRARRRVTYID
jgi:hypothetical protein